LIAGGYDRAEMLAPDNRGLGKRRRGRRRSEHWLHL